MFKTLLMYGVCIALVVSLFINIQQAYSSSETKKELSEIRKNSWFYEFYSEDADELVFAICKDAFAYWDMPVEGLTTDYRRARLDWINDNRILSDDTATLLHAWCDRLVEVSDSP